MKRVINFSGGKTSALMTIREYKPGDIVLFTDTGREHPLTYKFIDDFERNENIPVDRVSYEHLKSPGLKGFDAMNKKKNYYLPNRMQRICTTELKVWVAKRYLRPLIGTSFEQMIGFRFDEPNRVAQFKGTYKRVITKFPLYNDGITKEMVNQFWLTKSYNLEIPPILGNCDLCFLKGKAAIIRILQIFPELADKWIADEELSKTIRNDGGSTYFKDISYKQLLHIAKSQKSLFEMDNILPAFSCSCNNF